MSNEVRYERPAVTDEDVSWVCNALQLPETAFSGEDNEDPRLGVLKSMETLDIETCPGSVKTTLLVAKLAILAREWTERRRGICVLSHTNIARKEIEHRLGTTVEGRSLLSYPHFVGTIHGFVTQFLAVPWLRSKSFPITMIDDEIALARRWDRLPWNYRYALEKRHCDRGRMKVMASDFSVGNIPSVGNTTPTYRAVQEVCEQESKKGFFCYDEMFVWGRDLLDHLPLVREAVRERFPILFIDEVQDNSELQSALLYDLFSEGNGSVIRQRFGDANQAIYQYASQDEGAHTDPFPNPQICRNIPNSHRFGQEIADLATPLALDSQQLVGCGPSKPAITSDTQNRHAIFLFDDQTIKSVLPVYAQYLLTVFSDEDLHEGAFTAVGAVHRPGDDDHVPRFVGHYWPEYDYELASAEPTPATLVQYVAAGWKLARAQHETHHVVEKVAEAILRLAKISNPPAGLGRRTRKHRHILELLADEPQLRSSYLDFVTAMSLEDAALTADEWNDRWSTAIREVVEAIAGAPADSDEATAFLRWGASVDEDEQVGHQHQRDNIYLYPSDKPRVKIRVGSIHSVKGETHTSTLILDTFFFQHHLVTLKPWLLGQKSGGDGESNRKRSRLRLHYVAMTRPTHLLCLAMREDEFDEDEIEQLSTRWRVARIDNGAPEWL